MTPPLHTTREFHEKRTTVALIVGVWNEGEKFTRQLRELQDHRAAVDIIIADGKSDDGASDALALEGNVRTLLVNDDAARGLSVQYRIAIDYALREGYDSIIMMDGNGKDGVEAIPRFIAALAQGNAFVQGSRFLPGGCHRNTPLDRIIGIRFLFNPIMWLGSGYLYSDAMNGFKGCSRALLEDARVQPLRPIFIRYGLQYYLNYIAPRLGYNIAEIPVSRIYEKGVTHSKITGIGARIKILGELFATVLGRYNLR